MLVHLVVNSNLYPRLPSQPTVEMPPDRQAAPAEPPKPALCWDTPNRAGVAAGCFGRAMDMPGSGKRSCWLQTASSSSHGGYLRGKYKKQDQCGGFSMVRPAIPAFFLLPPL